MADPRRYVVRCDCAQFRRRHYISRVTPWHVDWTTSQRAAKRFAAREAAVTLCAEHAFKGRVVRLVRRG